MAVLLNSFNLLLIFVISCVALATSMPGGWTPQDPNNEEVVSLTNFAVQKRNLEKNSGSCEQLVEIVTAKSQVVSGVNYEMVVRIGPTDCEAKCSEELEGCKLKDGAEHLECTIRVWSQPWLKKKEVTKFECKPAVDNKPEDKPVMKRRSSASQDHLLKAPFFPSAQERTLFEVFIRKYNKTYQMQEEYENRFKIFKNNLKRMSLFNRLELGTAQYGLTEFADLSKREFRKHYTGLLHEYALKDDIKSIKVNVEDPLPDGFDWREKGAVTEVKNQGACGSCWAFSVTGNVEGQWFLTGHDLVSLSEQELVDCDKLDNGCMGGYMGSAYKEIIRLGGLESESEYPYKGRDKSCLFEKNETKASIESYVGLSDNETELAYFLMKHGPLSIGINANAMQFYFGGVSHPWKFLCSPDNLDHGVLIVGFGTEKSASRKKPVPYWIVKNSWGKFWGEKGYYRVYRGDGTCGVNKMVTSAIVKP